MPGRVLFKRPVVAPPVATEPAARLEVPRATRIEQVVWETERHATIAFRDGPLAACPAGTFAMVWVPGVDEVPMGVGYTDSEGRVTLTIEAKGDCTRALLALPVGSRIGVRGPYGRGFALPPAAHAAPTPAVPRSTGDADPSAPGAGRGTKSSRVCFVGGGTGIAPMARGAQAAAKAGHDVTVISGARSRDLLLLHDHLGGEMAAARMRYLPCTDDDSHGFGGFTTQRLEALLAAGESFDYVCACGPEPMMVKVTQICDEAGIPSEASLERYMKCAVGICDACTVGDGLRLCVEGPVLDAATLRDVTEYGVGHRDASGVLHPW